jgi:ubiquinone/menaquinone biosynthesis C-methylase UbiE
MNYVKDFHQYQSDYLSKYPAALKLRQELPELKGLSVLDVGCGSGIDIQYFIEKGALTVAGCDISKELLEIAMSNNPKADIRNNGFNYLTWKDNTFDIVWSKYALNCADDVSTPLKELFRVCKKGGTLLLQVTHPMRTLGMLSSKNYFNSGELVEYNTKNNSVIFIEPHHMFSDWISCITEAGFHITKCEEVLNRPVHEYTGEITPSSIIFVLKK